MIIYSEDKILKFREYGILIPVKDSRRTKTFDFLEKHTVIGKKIKEILIPSPDNLITKNDILRVHSKKYTNRLFSDKVDEEIIRTYELIDKDGNYYRYDPSLAKKPLDELFNDVLALVSGTYLCYKTALEKGFCFHFGGGMHHAQKEYGNGFCMVNDIVIGIRKLQKEKQIENVWVIDVDAHKGDGTAALTYNDSSITTLSIHMAEGWPLDQAEYDEYGKLNQSFIPSNIDIPIKKDENDLYIPKLEEGLEKLLDFPKPDLAIVLSGADPYEEDELPSAKDLKLTKSQMLQRDQLVYDFLNKNEIKKAYLMAGGYGDHTWEIYSQFLEWILLRRL